MGQFINTNVMSLNAQRNLNRSQGGLQTSLQRLSSGLRINSAKDDAAGLAISERMTGQIRGLNQAVRNANDGVSLMQTAEGSMAEMTNLLQRVRELAVQSSNATNSSGDRQAIQQEVGQLTSELNRIATSTQFNGKNLLDGTFGTASFQVGANANQTITAATGNFKTNQYGDYRVTGAVSSSAAGARIDGETLTVNGHIGSKVLTIPAASNSAQSVAAQVNAASDDTGVTATAKTELDITFTATGNYALTVNGDNAAAKAVSFSISTNDKEGLAQAAKAFNDVSSTTGVTAKVNDAGTGVTLTHDGGANIVLADTAVANSGDVVVQGAAPETLTGDTTPETATISGQVTFDSEKSFGVTGTATETVTNASETAALKDVASLDVTTVDNAQLAIAIADSALANINGQRATFGALQSRFESTVANLQTTSENLSAARSRIRDADFAQETANLTRAQILQQAGTAMLAQANQAPQNVLSLLG